MSTLQTVPKAAKYGLVKRQGTLSGPALQRARQAAAARPPPKSAGGLRGAFLRPGDSDDDLDEDEGGSSEVGRVNRDLTQRSLAAQAKLTEGLLNMSAEELAAFDYDGEYDSFKRSSSDLLSGHALSQGGPPPKARYVDGLKDVAAVREKEKERIYERKLLKERLEEEKRLGIKGEEEPKFITSAYKKKLQEEQRWNYEDRLNEELEKRNQASMMKNGMTGFYSGLLSKNIAFGGDVGTSAISAYTAGSARQAKYLSGQEGEQAELPVGSGGGDEGLNRRKRSRSPDIGAESRESERNVKPSVSDGAPPAPSMAEASTDKKSELISAARLRYLQRKQQGQGVG